MRMTKKKIDALVERCFYKASQGKQFNIMDLGKISRAGVEAYTTHGTEEATQAAVDAACALYALKPGADEAMSIVFVTV